MIVQLVTSFIASAAFGIIFHVPRRVLLQCGLVGMMGWAVYFIMAEAHYDTVVATLAASFIVALVSQICAKLFKMPIIVFSVSGIIPLVPGGLAYDAMRSLAEGDYSLTAQFATKAFMLSGAIAIGLLFSEVTNQLFKKSNR
ncbi:MAG: threonine/serine exporter family protein [Gorillibacterium sp.]|nr:threonine/serine exporter family protein [Gorillibacterium sp.]